MNAATNLRDPRERLKQGLCYPVVLSHVSAAALLLQLNLLLEAKLIDSGIWSHLENLLRLQDQANPCYL